MKCSQLIQRLDAYLDGETSAQEHAEISAHLAQCAQCRAEEAASRRTEEALHLLATEIDAPELTADLHRRLEAKPQWRFPWEWIALPAAALAVFALFALNKPAVESTTIEPETAKVTAQPKIEPVSPVAPVVSTDEPAPVIVETTPKIAKQPITQTAKMPETPATTKTPIIVTPEPAPEPEVAAKQDSETEAYASLPEATKPEGLVLFLGEPQPLRASSICFAEITRPDGSKSSMGQMVERDENGRPIRITIACENTFPEIEENQGG